MVSALPRPSQMLSSTFPPSLLLPDHLHHFRLQKKICEMEPSVATPTLEMIPTPNSKDHESTSNSLASSLTTTTPPLPPPTSLSLVAPPSSVSNSPSHSSLDTIVSTRNPYGGLPPELWSWIMAISNSSSNGNEPHPERFESLLQFILFMDSFHSQQDASPEIMACCLVSKRFYVSSKRRPRRSEGRNRAKKKLSSS